MKHLIFIILLAFILTASGAIRLDTQVSSAQGMVGEPMQLQIAVVCDNNEDIEHITPADFPSTLPFHLQQMVPQQQSQMHTSIINGRTKITRARYYTFTYVLIPRKTGRYDIPALDFKIDGKSFRSKPITLTIVKNQDEALENTKSSIQFTQKFDVATALIGKPLKVTWTVSLPLGSDISVRNLELPIEYLERNFVLKDNRPVEAPSRRKNINGIPCEVHDINLTLVPKGEGTFTLPPAALTILIPSKDQRQRRRNAWPFDDDFFFGRTQNYKTTTILTEEAQVVVAPLPSAGRPEDFSGIIGPLQVNATIVPDNVSVGDPITLTITMKGPSILGDCKLPDLRKQAELTASFRVSGDDPCIPKPDGSVTFQRTLRATTDKVTQIPPIVIPFYDTATGSYSSVATQALPLTVAPTREITLNDAAAILPIHQKNHAEDLRKETSINRVYRDIAPNCSTIETRTAELSPRDNPLHKQPFVFWLLAPCTIIIVAAIVKFFILMTQMTPAQRARKHARGNLLKALSRATDAVQCYDALQNYCVASFTLSPGTVTATDLQTLRSRYPRFDFDALINALEKCETARYAGQSGNLDEIKDSIRKATH